MARILVTGTLLALGVLAVVYFALHGSPAPAGDATASLGLRPHLADRTPIDLSTEERPADAAPAPEAPRPGELHRVPRGIMTPDRHHDLTSFRRELVASIGELESNLAACEPADAEFQLDLETVPGGARILDATVRSQGRATWEAIECTRAKLRGYTLGTPSAELGRHLTMPFSMRVAAR